MTVEIDPLSVSPTLRVIETLRRAEDRLRDFGPLIANTPPTATQLTLADALHDLAELLTTIGPGMIDELQELKSSGGSVAQGLAQRAFEAWRDSEFLDMHEKIAVNQANKSGSAIAVVYLPTVGVLSCWDPKGPMPITALLGWQLVSVVLPDGRVRRAPLLLIDQAKPG